MSPDLELMLFLMYMLGLTIAYGIYVESDIKYKNYIKYISIYFYTSSILNCNVYSKYCMHNYNMYIML